MFIYVSIYQCELLYYCRKDRKMALIQMSTVEEAIEALIVSITMTFPGHLTFEIVLQS